MFEVLLFFTPGPGYPMDRVIKRLNNWARCCTTELQKNQWERRPLWCYQSNETFLAEPFPWYQLFLRIFTKRKLESFEIFTLAIIRSEIKGLSHMQVVSFRLSLDSEFILDSSGLVKTQELLCFCWRE